MGAFSIINNISAITAQNRLAGTDLNLRNTLTRLSSGLRINSSGDDAAGLAIADGLRADVRALNQAARNANDGVSILQTADSALNEISLLLTRAVTLAEQAASGTSGQDGSDSKLALDDEFQDILTEIGRIAQSVEFNELNLLGGATSGSTGTPTVSIQVGLDDTAASKIEINTVSINVSGSATGAFTAGTSTTRISVEFGMLNASLTTAAGAVTTLSTLQTAVTNTARARGVLGSGMNRLNTTTTIIRSLSTNLQSAESQIRDANIASEIVNLTQYQILTQTGIAALAQANVAAQNVLTLLR
ncbi:MAG TPA: flagellin [Acidobacteriota bacterium]|nr:flagellin [Acidobacteriota bacterium]